MVKYRLRVATSAVVILASMLFLMKPMHCAAAYFSPLDIKNNLPFAPNGIYSIDPDGDDTSFSVYADMTAFGGGWAAGVNRLRNTDPISITSNTGTLSHNLSTAFTIDLTQLGAERDGLSIRYRFEGFWKFTNIPDLNPIYFDGYYTGKFSDPIPSLDQWTYWSSNVVPYIYTGGVPSLSNFDIIDASPQYYYITKETIYVRENWSLPLPPAEPVPEPSSILLFGSGLAGIVGMVKGRRRVKNR